MQLILLIPTLSNCIYDVGTDTGSVAVGALEAVGATGAAEAIGPLDMLEP
jgi:precorrin-6B methylase 2